MEVPVYRPSVPVQTPGVPEVRVQPMTPAISSANVAEAVAGVGSGIEKLGSEFEQHLVMRDRLRAQQEDYATKAAYKEHVQNVLADPQNGLLVKYQGVNSEKALEEFDQMRKGVPAQPGQPAKPSLRDQFMQGKSLYQQKSLEKDFDAIDSMYRGKLINHVLEQTEAASKAINEANIDSSLKNGALVTPTAVEDPSTGKLIPAITLAEKNLRDTITNDVYFKKQGHPPEVINKLVQDHVDQLAKVAVEANAPKSWQDAQKILDASSASPSAKAAIQNHINGARIDQYTEALTKSVVSDGALRTPDGQIDEIKAQEFVRRQIDEQEKGANPLPPGHGNLIFGRLQSQIAAENKGIEQRGAILLDTAKLGIYKAAQDPAANRNAVHDKFIKQGKFINGKDREAADEFFDKVFKRDPASIDDAWSSVPASQKDALESIKNGSEFRAKLPYQDEQRAFLDVLKQKVIEGNNRSRDAVYDIYMEQLKKIPTGAPRFFGFGKQMLPQYEIDESLQKNQPVVKAVGGLAAASALAQTLGGPDKLAPDTNESKAILLLAKHGKPINASTISTVLEKHPELLK
jgi:hypothetical protein